MRQKSLLHAVGIFNIIEFENGKSLFLKMRRRQKTVNTCSECAHLIVYRKDNFLFIRGLKHVTGFFKLFKMKIVCHCLFVYTLKLLKNLD